MKKILIISIVVLLGIIFLPNNIATSMIYHQRQDIVPSQLQTFTNKAIESYYRNKDLGENNILEDYYSKDILKLLQAKIEMDHFQRQTFHLIYNEYKIIILPYEDKQWYEQGNKLFLTYQVKKSWEYNYEPTNASELIDITVVKVVDGTYQIDGCYERYESLTYGPIDELYKDSRQNDMVAITSIGKILDNYVADFKEQCIQKEKIISVYNPVAEERYSKGFNDQNIDTNTEHNHELNPKHNSKHNQDINHNKEEVELSIMNREAINRNAIKSWVRENFDKELPTSALAEVRYYDFSRITDAYDCTNFVSHALLAGGATRHDRGSKGIVGTDQWYYRSTANRSTSWTGVNQIYLFLTRNNPSKYNIGPYASEKELYFDNAFIGDIVQGHNGTTWRHSVIVTNLVNHNVYVTGRTSTEVYNNNQLATTIYGTQRLLHIEGNYTK